MNNESKRIKKEVKKLAKEEKYDEIYSQYGPKYFRKYVSKEYQKADINELRGQGKYLEIYAKYGKLDLESNIRLKKALKNKELPVKNGSIARALGYIKIAIAGLLQGISISYATAKLYDPVSTQLEINNNKKQYEQQIEDYNEKIEEYSKKFDVTKQSDLEIIMRCMRDLHNTIEGYGEPKLDIAGYRGLDVIDEGGIGVCRNFAPNIADKLNAINPEYNARTIIIYNSPEKFSPSNIETINIDENGNKIVIRGNEQELYVNNILNERAIILDDAIAKTFYNEKGEITSKLTIKEDENVEITYENGKKIQEEIRKGNETVTTTYNENGEVDIERRTVMEEKDGVAYYKDFLNGQLIYLSEEAEEYYNVTMWNPNGNISLEIKANSDKEIKKDYNSVTGKLNYISILQDGQETITQYDDNGNEISCETKKADRENRFIEAKATSEMISNVNKYIEYQEAMKNYKIDKKIPNHEIVAVDIESENITLLIDPTYTGLGVYKDGKIVMFNEQNQEDAKYIRGNVTDAAGHNGLGQFTQYPVDYIKSFKEPTLSMEELEAKYGLDAQNKMLEQIEKEDGKNTFKESLKITDNDKTTVSYDFENNTVYIENNKTQEQDKTEER